MEPARRLQITGIFSRVFDTPGSDGCKYPKKLIMNPPFTPIMDGSNMQLCWTEQKFRRAADRSDEEDLLPTMRLLFKARLCLQIRTFPRTTMCDSDHYEEENMDWKLIHPQPISFPWGIWFSCGCPDLWDIYWLLLPLPGRPVARSHCEWERTRCKHQKVMKKNKY